MNSISIYEFSTICMEVLLGCSVLAALLMIIIAFLPQPEEFSPESPVDPGRVFSKLGERERFQQWWHARCQERKRAMMSGGSFPKFTPPTTNEIAPSLPLAAGLKIARIHGLLFKAHLLEGAGDMSDPAIATMEMERRYLIDTVNAFFAITVVQPDADANKMLVDQLSLLEESLANRVVSLTDARRQELTANGSFLQERLKHGT